jgi:hypothetical protein
MSCEHGNWPPCGLCDALDAAYDRGFAAGKQAALASGPSGVDGWPPLPEPANAMALAAWGPKPDYYTAEQMRAYAQATLASGADELATIKESLLVAERELGEARFAWTQILEAAQEVAPESFRPKFAGRTSIASCA